MFDTALPFWATNGVDFKNGGFTERLDANGRDLCCNFKRTRVTARQIYVFSHASLQGWRPETPVLDHGYAALRRAWLGPQGGWARTLTRDGAILDATPDLYDIAFSLFALGWYMRATGDETALELALETLDFLDERLRWPDGGFLHDADAAGPRQQNPHMHLMEAALSLQQAHPHRRFAALADELVDLFKTKLFDSNSRTLTEYFGDGWARLDDSKGSIVEPGHQFEWAWILGEHSKLFGADHTRTIKDLVELPEAFGVDPLTKVTFNQIDVDGARLNAGSRTWPNTERIKGWIALSEVTGVDCAEAVASSTHVLFNRHLDAQPGLWREEFDESGRCVTDFVPSSTLYHVFLAFSEALRLRGA